MKKTTREDQLESLDESTISLKEPAAPARTAPVMLCRVTVYPIKHGGDDFQSADVFIDHCCKENEAACNELFIQRSNVPAGGRDPANFCKVLYHEQPIDACPFCGAKIEVVKEPREVAHYWY